MKYPRGSMVRYRGNLVEVIAGSGGYYMVKGRYGAIYEKVKEEKLLIDGYYKMIDLVNELVLI